MTWPPVVLSIARAIDAALGLRPITGTAAMHDAIIAATGLYTPPFSVSNSELVEAFNAYVERFNAEHADAIASGEIVALIPSSVQFIEKASGIMSRHVMNKTGILDPAAYAPSYPSAPTKRSRSLPKSLSRRPERRFRAGASR